jgi:hypothetical protein
MLNPNVQLVETKTMISKIKTIHLLNHITKNAKS